MGIPVGGGIDATRVAHTIHGILFIGWLLANQEVKDGLVVKTIYLQEKRPLNYGQPVLLGLLVIAVRVLKKGGYGLPY